MSGLFRPIRALADFMGETSPEEFHSPLFPKLFTTGIRSNLRGPPWNTASSRREVRGFFQKNCHAKGL
jgi:hypothetical protein